MRDLKTVKRIPSHVNSDLEAIRHAFAKLMSGFNENQTAEREWILQQQEIVIKVYERNQAIRSDSEEKIINRIQKLMGYSTTEQAKQVYHQCEAVLRYDTNLSINLFDDRLAQALKDGHLKHFFEMKQVSDKRNEQYSSQRATAEIMVFNRFDNLHNPKDVYKVTETKRPYFSYAALLVKDHHEYMPQINRFGRFILLLPDILKMATIYHPGDTFAYAKQGRTYEPVSYFCLGLVLLERSDDALKRLIHRATAGEYKHRSAFEDQRYEKEAGDGYFEALVPRFNLRDMTLGHVLIVEDDVKNQVDDFTFLGYVSDFHPEDLKITRLDKVPEALLREFAPNDNNTSFGNWLTHSDIEGNIKSIKSYLQVDDAPRLIRLLQRFPSICSYTGAQGQTLWHLAAEKNAVQCLKGLIQYQSDHPQQIHLSPMDRHCSQIGTCLHVAMAQKNYEAVALIATAYKELVTIPLQVGGIEKSVRELAGTDQRLLNSLEGQSQKLQQVNQILINKLDVTNGGATDNNLILSEVKKYYKYSDSNRYHLFSVGNHNLKGDKYKAYLLESFKSRLEKAYNLPRLETIIWEIRNSHEYQNELALGTGLTTRLLGLKTDSVKAFEQMCNEATDHFKKRCLPLS